MNIIILTHEFHPYPGGISTYCLEMSKAAQAAGNNVQIIAPDYQNTEYAAFSELQHDFKTIRFPGHFYSSRRLPTVLKIAAKAAKEARIRGAILHAADYSFGIALSILNRFNNIPFFLTVHGSELLQFGVSKHVRALRAQHMCAQAQGVFANSQFTSDLVKTAHTGKKKPKVVLTPLGVDHFWHGEAAEQFQTPILQNLPNGRHVVCAVGRLEPRKGHEIALSAISILPYDLKEKIIYVIAGTEADKQYAKDLRRRAEKENLPVIFTGRIPKEDIRRLYSISDALYLPGQVDPMRVEGLGLVFLEAGAQGTPSVTSHIGGIPEAVLDERTGLVTLPASVNDQAKALTKILEDAPLRAKLGTGAKYHAMQFTWERCARISYDFASNIMRTGAND